MILNLPSTVEMATPNVYADQIEWFGRHIRDRDAVILSVHPHNDRGTAVAAAELALMAGAERVEGTLFGNGERTGNVDLVTLALNLHTQGVDPGLDLSEIDEAGRDRRVLQPAAGASAPSLRGRAGLHGVLGLAPGRDQEGLRGDSAKGGIWEVPYLPIDPADVGRSYETVIRINSQSGKGGVAYVLEADHGLRLPRGLQVEFSRVVQQQTDAREEELDSKTLWDLFEREYLEHSGRLELVDHADSPLAGGRLEVRAKLRVGGAPRRVRGDGTGPIDAFVAALRNGCKIDAHVLDYSEHALGDGEDAVAIAYVQVRDGAGNSRWGVGRRRSIVGASLDAVLSAVNRLQLIA